MNTVLSLLARQFLDILTSFIHEHDSNFPDASGLEVLDRGPGTGLLATGASYLSSVCVIDRRRVPVPPDSSTPFIG